MKKLLLVGFAALLLGSCGQSGPVDNATTPTLSEDGKTITYGLYPQSRVTKKTLINSLGVKGVEQENGWYLYKDEYYVRVDPFGPLYPYKDYYHYNDGSQLDSRESAWFKCEPIKWNVLSSENGEYFVVSNALLDSQQYNIFGTRSDHLDDYEYSDIRVWLNNDFFNNAFKLDSSKIIPTHIWNHERNDILGGNYLDDKVFLLDAIDYKKEAYGFASNDEESETRTCPVTDYSILQCARTDDDPNHSLATDPCYWTRSYRNTGDINNILNYSSSTGESWVAASQAFLYVRPGMTIKL